jgi:diguanylate cyclase (GGDEF)-like protein/PAS domain S-box-containing protein
MKTSKFRFSDKNKLKKDSYYNAVLNAIPDAILVSNAEGIITLANLQSSLLLGYELDELIGTPIDLLLPSRFRVDHQVMRERFLKDPSIKMMGAKRNVVVLHKNNSELDVEIKLGFIEKDHQIAVVSALRDVSEQRKVEKALRSSETRFRLMANASPSMIWITDIKGRPVFVNKTWLEFTGIPDAQAYTLEAWQTSIHPDDKQAIYDVYRTAIDAEDYITTEYRLKRKDGNWRWILDNGIPFHNENDVFCGYIGSAIDITERKQLEAELAVAAAAFESHEAMVITDVNTVILRVNKNFAEITGYSPEELVGRKMNLFKSDRHSNDFYALMWKSIHEKGSWQGEIWDKRKNGEVYLKWLTITAIKNANNEIVNYVGAHIDITERKKAQEEIERLAFYDPLTGLPNRRLLIDRLKHALASSHRTRAMGALMFIDMDNFKTLNDTLGHDMGDALLIQVSERLQSCVRDCDTVARLGGDEFVVMLESLDNESQNAVRQAESVGDKILDKLNQNYQLGMHHYHSTPSIGITIFRGKEEAAEVILKQADIAMYQAKASGRNAIRFFNPKMQAIVSKRFALEEDLHQALAKDEFKLYYQLQVTHNKIIGAEALIRWEHPQRGLVPPTDFIPLAEETGLIIAIGQWVLETACLQIKRWENKPLMDHLQLAVNISAKQFRQLDFVDNVSSIIARTQIKAARLKLELTESLLLDDIEEIIEKMNALRELGVHFSMDDFGTGYSSLSYLTKLPLHQMKIDQSFIRNIGLKPSDAAIVQTIINMSKNLGIEIIAEGVETKDQKEFLEKHGCPVYQGYLYSKPIPLEEFEAHWLFSNKT